MAAVSLPTDPRELAEFNAWLRLRAEEARDDIVKFFDFVAVEEFKRTRVKCKPHQRVMLDFILKHDRSVVMMPVGTSKTFCMGIVSLFLLGLDPTSRGAYVCATQGQAIKAIGMTRSYIEESARLRLVFPDLRPTRRKGEPWTQDKFTVDRPFGIRDPSLVAIGIDGGLPGARLNWVVVDDILTRENTATPEQRAKVYEWFDSTVLSRLDPHGARLVVTNTAWHPEDLPHLLWRPKKAMIQGWPTIRMEIEGNIEVTTPSIELPDGRVVEDSWGIDDEIAKELRPASASPSDPLVRLTAHDPDPKNEVPLWPERFDAAHIAKLRRSHLPHRFNQLFMNICRDDSTSMCQREWIDKALERGRKEGVHSLVSEYKGPHLTFTGLDLAVSPGEEHDDTAFVTFEVRPDGTRVLLDVDASQMNGPQIMEKLFSKQRLYNSMVRVESNAAQAYIVQFALEKNRSIPIDCHMTGRAKAHPEHGVPGFFLELQNGAWIFPCGKHGEVHSAVQRLIDACLYYEPSNHTDDVLMAMYFAREQARKWGVLSGGDTAANAQGGSIGMNIMSR